MGLEKLLPFGMLIGVLAYSPQSSAFSPLCPKDEYGAKQFCTPVDYIHKYKIGPEGFGQDAYRRHNKIKITKEDVEERATGPPKKDIYNTVPLGHGGWIIGGITKGTQNPNHVWCFENRDGIDIYIHEPPPNPDINREEIKLYVGIDKNPETTRWVYVGKGVATQKNKGFIGFDLGRIKKGYWIKVVDNKSNRSTKYIGFAGFDISAILIRYPCSRNIS